jgi:hypothetical protein
MDPTTRVVIPPKLAHTIPRRSSAGKAHFEQLSPDVRFGQLLANLGFLVEDQTDQSLWDVEDARLLEVMEYHRVELLQRQRSDD